MFERFATAGIGNGLPFDADALDPEVRTALRRGVVSARAGMARESETVGEAVNGWMVMDPFGDRDFFGDDYMKRAATAMIGWGGNDKIEAYYPMAIASLNSTKRFNTTM